MKSNSKLMATAILFACFSIPFTGCGLKKAPGEVEFTAAAPSGGGASDSTADVSAEKPALVESKPAESASAAAEASEPVKAPASDATIESAKKEPETANPAGGGDKEKSDAKTAKKENGGKEKKAKAGEGGGGKEAEKAPAAAADTSALKGKCTTCHGIDKISGYIKKGGSAEKALDKHESDGMAEFGAGEKAKIAGAMKSLK